MERRGQSREPGSWRRRSNLRLHGHSINGQERTDPRRGNVLHPHWKPDTLDRLGDEILRLRAVVPAPDDAALKTALASRLTELTNDWCAKARAAGMAPPPNGFNPYTASDRALQSAFLWMTVAGVVPLDSASHDGGLELREDMLEAIALRTPGLGEQLIESYAGDPVAQRVILERELFRLGQPMCRAGDTNEQLIVRRAQLLRKDHEAVNAPELRRPGRGARRHQAPGTEANARIIPGTQTKPNRLGIYSGAVEIKDPRTGQWVRKNAESTFFPKHWTRAEVRTAILEAFANRTDLGDGRRQATLPSGMKITGFVDSTGRITSAYPEMENE